VAKPPLRELGVDPVSGKPMVIKDGRFGPYVTDGETNASLRKGDLPETITDERASELLQDRRDRGPAKKRSSKKKAADKKKAPAKKRAAKKKAGAKKAAAKQPAEAPSGDSPDDH
jgi:DNA topoisomerase-1